MLFYVMFLLYFGTKNFHTSKKTTTTSPKKQPKKIRAFIFKKIKVTEESWEFKVPPLMPPPQEISPQ